jgi:hypothetical protein
MSEHMSERVERLVHHLEAGIESSERGECRYHLRHALQYAESLRRTGVGCENPSTDGAS